jgi:hypothetical protein
MNVRSCRHSRATASESESESVQRYPCQYCCMPGAAERSSAEIGLADLLRLGALAAEAEAELFARNPRGSGRYADRLLGRALCQGAAVHYVNKKNGVKDFDVWSFYAQLDDWPFPPRWRGMRDFGPSKFGRYPGDPARYSGRACRSSWAFASGRAPALTRPMASVATLPPVGLGRLGSFRPRQWF